MTDRPAYIIAEWTKGRTLTDIAREMGISRERASAIIGRLHSHIPPGLLASKEIAHELGVSVGSVQRWIEGGLLVPGVHNRISLAEARAVLAELRDRPCYVCGQPVQSHWTSRCPEHRDGSKYASYPYAVWSEERRQDMRRRTEAYARADPDKYVLVSRRANYVHRLVKSGVPRAKALARGRREYPYPWRGEC